MVKALEQHCGPPEYLNPDEHLSEIKQTGLVKEYRQEWAKRIARVSNWPEHCRLGVFLSGLKEELRSEVKLHKNKTVYRAASIAVEIEKQEAPKTRGFKAGMGSSTRPNPYPLVQREETQRTTYSSHPNMSSHRTHTSDSYWYVVKQERRDKGLCFRCGEQFWPGHRCNKNFSLIEIVEKGEEIVEPMVDHNNNEIMGTNAEIFLGVSKSNRKPKTK